ncbi:hypothetical protein ACH4SP_40955 [Streptomyces sp. NPDC021093]
MADTPTTESPQETPDVTFLPLLGACGCGPSCQCGCQAGGSCQCGGGCG